jgi:hypothetical protein
MRRRDEALAMERRLGRSTHQGGQRVPRRQGGRETPLHSLQAAALDVEDLCDQLGGPPAEPAPLG